MNTLDLFSLKGKTVVVFGGEGLLGRCVCETVRDLGGDALSVDNHRPANYVRDATNVHACIEIADYLEKVDAVVNCIVGHQGPVTYPSSYWDTDLAAGLGVACNIMVAFRDKLMASKGIALHIGSDLSLKAPDPHRYAPLYKPLSYSVVKHGIIGLVRYYAAHWGPSGVRVNCLCPGGIDQGQDAPRAPLGRLAGIEEMKGPIAFMLSRASSYMTGAVVSVDGGSTCW